MVVGHVFGTCCSSGDVYTGMICVAGPSTCKKEVTRSDGTLMFCQRRVVLATNDYHIDR